MSESTWKARLVTQVSNPVKLYPEASGVENTVRAHVECHRRDAYDVGWLANRSKLHLGERSR